MTNQKNYLGWAAAEVLGTMRLCNVTSASPAADLFRDAGFKFGWAAKGMCHSKHPGLKVPRAADSHGAAGLGGRRSYDHTMGS